MCEKQIDPSIPIINQLKEGDEVRISTRNTPMEILDIEKNKKKVYAHLILENRHGKYKLTRTETGEYVFAYEKTNDEGDEYWYREDTNEPIEIELV